MNLLDISVITFIIFIIFKFYTTIYKKNNNNDNLNTNTNKKRSENKDENENDNEKCGTENFSVEIDESLKEKKENIYDSSMKYIDQILKSKQKRIVNPYLLESQFHNDYRDTLNAIIIAIPKQTQLFNRSNLPIINVSTPSNKEVAPLIKNFIKEMNRVLDDNVADELHVRDWKNNYGEKEYKSGWDKQQEKLGLPASIYNTPTKKEHINLIKVDNAERFETEDEIRYVVVLILQKPSAKDQMMLKVSFQINKQDINLDREFFEKGKNESETLIKIEEAFVMGFLTNNSFGKHSIRDKNYNFDGITDGRIFSQKEIMKQLNEHRKQYELETVFH
jgi:hypothetical protein